MRRLAVSLDALADRNNLVLATWKAARGKHDRPAVARFLADLDSRLTALSRSILDGSAPQGRFREFVIHDPKRRTIHAACFADRVLHHAILNLTEPVFERALVDSSFACRPGKGVHAAVGQVRAHVRYMDDIVWWCDSPDDARQTLAALQAFMVDELRLTLKPDAPIRPSAQGLLYCGHRITPGLVLPSLRKQRRYRAAAERLHLADAQGLHEQRHLQRAHDAALGALAHTQSLHFRRRVWARLHNPDPGCPST